MYLFLFIFTILISLKTSWTYNNFTYLSYQPHLRIYFLIWVTTISCFLLFKILKLFKQITYLTNKDKFLIKFSFITMLVGAYLPYHPDHENLISVLHVLISSLGTLSLLILIQILINRILLVDVNFHQKIVAIFSSQLVMISLLIIMFGLINSIIELFYTFTVLSTLALIERHFSI